MNIAYFRTSTRDRVETLATLKQSALDAGFSLLGEVALSDGQSTLLVVCRPEWAQAVIGADPNLLGLLPCSVTVIDKGSSVVVGASTPALLGRAAPSLAVQEIAEQADAALRALVEQAAGVGALKPKRLLLYSSHTCPYCKMEKSWLEQRKTAFDLVYVDEDAKAAEDLVRRTGQMGVPVTEVVYDEGESEFVLGFDQARLQQIIAAM